MNRITLVAESANRVDDLKAELAQYFEAECLCLGELPESAPGEFTFVDVNLRDTAKIPSLKRWLARRPTNGRVIFGVNQKSHVESIQAFAIGATDLLSRPIDGRRLSMMLSAGSKSIAKDSAAAASEACEGIAASLGGLKKMFAAAMLGEALDMQVLHTVAGQIVERIEEDGLTRWLDVIRGYHSQTYQHCLIVTAVAASFGRHLGFSDQTRNGWHRPGCCTTSARLASQSTQLERAKGFEPSTPTLARSCSTPELHPHPWARRHRHRRPFL